MFSFMKTLVTGGEMGRIYATTEKQYYVEGELVKGQVVCETKSPLMARGIDLLVSGYEKTEWHDRRDRTEVLEPATAEKPAVTKHIPVFHRHRAKTTFFNQTIRVYNLQDGVLNPGTYTFPFQYQLPDNIPGSFHERVPMPNIPPESEWVEDDAHVHDFGDSDDEDADEGRSGMLAVVHYKLKVTLDVADGLWMKDMHCKVPLIIHPKLEVGIQPASQEFTQDVIVCCCINKGKCTVCARFDKLAYVAGETANVRADIKNASTSDLKTRVTLRRYLQLKSNNGRKNLTEDIVHQEYEPVPGETDALDRPMPLMLDGPKVKPTTTGKLVACNYEYLVHCEVSMGADIQLKMPVTIYMPQPPPIPNMMPMVAVPSPPPMMAAPAGPPMMAPAPMMAPQQPGMMPPQQQGYPPQQGGYPPQQPGYPPQQQGGYPPQQGGYPPQQQQGYPPQQGGYPPQQGGYPPQGQAYVAPVQS